MFDPALTGFRDKVGELERYTELVLDDPASTLEDRVFAEKVRREAVGIGRLLDKWRGKPRLSQIGANMRQRS